MRYEPESLELINTAGKMARDLGHSYVGSVHLLLAMVSQRGSVGQILRGFGMDAATTHDLAALLYGKGTAQLPLPQGLSTDAKQILRGAAKEARNRKGNQILPMHMLLSLHVAKRRQPGNC